MRRGMKELELRRLIPLAAVASLVTVGCGSASPQKIAKERCQLYEECSKADFDDEFDSMSECVDYYEGYIEEYHEYVSEEYGAACADAFLELIACTVEESTCAYDYGDAYEKSEDEYGANAHQSDSAASRPLPY